jgi:hypothetical protein
VVLIILIVMLSGPFSKEPKTQLTQAQVYTDRSADSACSMNRMGLKTQIVQFQTMNPGIPLSTELLRKKINFPQCSRGGAYMIGQDGTVYCTKHFPPPIQELQNSVPQTPAETPQPATMLMPPAAGTSGNVPPATLPPAATPFQ